MILINSDFYSRRQAQFEEITGVDMREGRLSKFSLLYQTASKGPPMARQDDAPFVPPIPSRDTVVELLKENVMIVHAKKENGEPMELKCTLRHDMTPNSVKKRATLAEVVTAADPMSVAGTLKQTDPNLITVWAVDRQAWRSFRYERLTQIQRAESA